MTYIFMYLQTNNVDTFSQSASEDVYEKTLFVIPESYYRFKVGWLYLDVSHFQCF